jgi:hypothetical protein
MTKIKELTVTNIRKFFRRICVEFAALIPIIALVFFLLNASLSKDSFTLTKEKILLNEKDFISQKFLIDLFRLNNQFSLAETQSERALVIASSIPTKKTFRDLLARAKTLKNQEFLISEEINNWGKLTNSYPSYRDGYIKLAILSWKTSRLFETKKYLEMALTLDPNFEVAKTMLFEATKSPSP